MKIEKYLVLCLLILAGCQTTEVREIAQFTGRPFLDDSPCVANSDGTCFEDGELKDVTNKFCVDSFKWDLMQRHLEDTEYYEWRCRKYGKCK